MLLQHTFEEKEGNAGSKGMGQEIVRGRKGLGDDAGAEEAVVVRGSNGIHK